MPPNEDRRPIDVVTACMTPQGFPTLVLTTVEVTPDERANAIHYYLAAGELLERGYDEPMVHFDADEAPPFLHPAVRAHGSLSPDPTTTRQPEEVRCPA